jgi:phospholipid transport system substrate-binding protein
VRHNGWVVGALLGVVLLLAPLEAPAAGPTEELQRQVTQVLDLVRDPARGRPAVRQVIDGILDFPEMAERALGRHWSARTPEERAEFVRLFSDLLEVTYVAAIERHGHDVISYLKESVAGDEATVETKVVGKTETRVDYRMHRRDGRWLVYDVLIGGLSVVDNLRSQLSRLLRDSSYADLIAKLRETGAGQASR